MNKQPGKSAQTRRRRAAPATGPRERFVSVDGVKIRWKERGKGTTLLMLDDPASTSPLADLLAQAFRVVQFEIPLPDSATAGESESTQASTAATLARAAIALGLEPYVLVARSSSAPVALWQAIHAAEHVSGLVLVAPRELAQNNAGGSSAANRDNQLLRRLEEMKAPTLVILGTNDDVVPREAARAYAQRIPTSYVVLVYDAGNAIETERPEALLGALRDFVDQREKFVVNRASTAINP